MKGEALDRQLIYRLCNLCQKKMESFEIAIYSIQLYKSR
jgi:hypothetical protein